VANLGRREVAGLALRLAVWLPVLFWLAWAWGWHYGHFFLPLYREVLDLALPDFGVVNFEIGRTHEYVFKARVIAEHMMVREGQVLPSGFTVDTHTPMYVALIHPIILAAAALVWPRLNRRGRMARLLLSLPFLVLLGILDAPLVLASSINDLLTFSLNPRGDAASKLIDWVHVLDGGGRYALALSAVLGAAWLHGSMRGAWNRRASTTT
jgi:hypothetical protein